MRGSFFGMNVAMSGLFAAQRNMDTISHNVANVQTDGYSRQVIRQSASSPIRLYNHTGMVGTGTEVISIARVRDIYLDQKYWYQNTRKGEWNQKASLNDQILTRIDETGADGYNKALNEFYAALSELSKDPADMSLRSVVKEEAISMTTYFNNLYNNLEKMQEELNFDVKTKVDLINSIGHRIESLNQQIYHVEVLGETANDLRDARDLLVDQLSGLVDVEVGEHNYGKLPSGADDLRFYIYIGGIQFLKHFDKDNSIVNELQCIARKEKINEEDLNGLFDIVWAKPAGKNQPVEISGGELRGILDVRDGNAAIVQEKKFNMMGTKISIAINTTSVGALVLDLNFNEYVRNVENMTAGDLAEYLQDEINKMLENAGLLITPENRAEVYTTSDGKLEINLSGVDGGSGVSPKIATFVFTAPAQLKLALGLEEITGGGTSDILTSNLDIVQAVKTNAYKGIPYYLRKLNEYVRVYAMAFNEGYLDLSGDQHITSDEVLTGHADGYNIKQDLGEPPAGVRFFTMMDSHGNTFGSGEFLAMEDGRMPSLVGLSTDSVEYQNNINAIYNAYQKVTAKNFCVSSDVMNDVSLIATSSAAGEVENSTNLTAVMSQRFNRHMFAEGSAEDFMQSVTTDAAVNTNQAEYMYDNQFNYINLLMTRRQSVSGVNQDEEFADLIRQQHAYNASAQMITIYNQIYDTLINGLGV